jgi:hypothetical protein
LGPDPRRALGPAATPAASTGRTRDRTRPMLQNVKKALAMAPSTRDPISGNLLSRELSSFENELNVFGIAACRAFKRPKFAARGCGLNSCQADFLSTLVTNRR